jgi:hypothetical protein
MLYCLEIARNLDVEERHRFAQILDRILVIQNCLGLFDVAYAILSCNDKEIIHEEEQISSVLILRCEMLGFLLYTICNSRCHSFRCTGV